VYCAKTGGHGVRKLVHHTTQSYRETARFAASSWVFHLFVAGIIILLVFLRTPTVFSGDTDTARNYLNTIVSSLSTILALCISIILVAIQMTASNYTHRVLDFFVRLPYNVSLFLFYLVTIMHSFLLMARITDLKPEPLSPVLQQKMSADLVLVIICFLSLLLYMYEVVQLLKPEKIIDLILRDYNRAFARGRYRSALDNVEQICDIAKRTATFSDSVTGMRCMEVMLTIAAKLPLPKGEADPLLEIHNNLVDQWVEIVGVAVKEKESGLLNGVLTALHVQCTLYVEGRSWAAAELVIRAYRHLCFSHLLAEGQVFYVERVANHLYEIGAHAVMQGPRGQLFCLRTWRVIQTIGENAFAANPSSVSTMVEGFLLSDGLRPTFDRLAHEDERVLGLVTYFELWKSFALVASVRDVAHWAAWWTEQMTDSFIIHHGKCLAILIAEHVNRTGLKQTMYYVWKWDESPCDFDEAREVFGSHLMELFDGWPWPDDARAE
jgi:hypothetical protein